MAIDYTALKYFDRVAFLTGTGGSGMINVGDRLYARALLPGEAGAADGDPTLMLIEEGTDFELVKVTFHTGSPDTVSRDEVVLSMIGGTVGTSKMSLGGNAICQFIHSAEAIASLMSRMVAVEAHAASTSNPHGVTKAQVGLGNVTNDAQLKAADLDTDGTLAGNSDSKVPSQKAVKTYADALIAANDAMVFKGVIDCSANPNYPAADRGHTYRVSVAGKIGGGSGLNVEAGDILLCLTDGTSAGNQATVGSAWTIVQANLDGAVIGPASATDGNFARFDGTSGKLIKGDISLSTDTSLAGNSDSVLATQRAVKAYVDAWAATDSHIAAAIHATVSKATPVDADEIGIVDSAASYVLKKLTWANLKATLKSYFDAIYVPLSGSKNLTGGFTATPANKNNFASFTVDGLLGQKQYGTNHGAFTITAPAADTDVDILVVNDGSAGAITFSGFTVGSYTGDALTTTNGNKFIISIRRINGTSTYLIKALQ